MAELVGVTGAAKQLGLHEPQLYARRKKVRYEASRSETERELATGDARLKRPVAKAGKKYEATTDSEHSLPVAPNRLKQDVTMVLDLFSCMVVGWAMDKRMEAKLVRDALQMAFWRRHMPKGVMVHSDRSGQYCSRRYQALLAKQDLSCSMSGKAIANYNACAESFFHTLKVKTVHGERFTTRGSMRRAVFEYIEGDGSRTGRRCAHGYISPTAFETKMAA